MLTKRREKNIKNEHGNYCWLGPFEADKSFSIGPVKMPQTAHYKRQNKFMQIAANSSNNNNNLWKRVNIDRRSETPKIRSELRGELTVWRLKLWQLTLRRTLSINHFNRNLCVVDVVNTTRHDNDGSSTSSGSSSYNNNNYSVASPFWPQMSTKRVTASRFESNLESDRRKPIFELSFSGHTRAVFQKLNTVPHRNAHSTTPLPLPTPPISISSELPQPFIVSSVSTSKSSVGHLLRSNYVS